MKLSIRVKLIAFTVSIILLVGGSISLYSIYQGRERILHTFESDALQTATLLSGTVVNSLYFLDIATLRNRLQNARVNPDIAYTYVLDREGVVLTDGTGQNSLEGQKLADDFSGRMLESKGWMSVVDGKMLKVGGPLLTGDGERVGYLQLGYSLGHPYEIIHSTTRVSLYITLLCLVIGAGLAVVVATGFSRPIESIVAAAQTIGRGHLDTRLTMRRGDEFAALADSINRMAGALQLRRAETERKSRELSALHAVTASANRSLELRPVLNEVIEKVTEVFNFAATQVYLLNTRTGEFQQQAYFHGSQEILSKTGAFRLGEGIVGRVGESGEPLVFSDILEDARYREWSRSGSMGAAGFRFFAVFPIKNKLKTVGVITCTAESPRKLTADETQLMTSMTDQIGVAVENARLFEETRRNLEGIRALHEIDMAISSSLELKQVLHVLLDKIDLFLPYATATVRLFNRQSGQLEPVACRNLDEEEWKAAAWRPGRGPANAVFESKKPLIIRNCLEDPRIKDPEFFRKHRLVSYLGVPMFAKDEILGVLSFYTSEEHEFSGEEMEFLITLAGQAAIAIHNSEVYEELVKTASDLSKSNRVKDEFLSVMSHELRTPLNVVMGYTGMIKDGLLGEINPEQEKALEKVISRARDQLTMISSILQATQLEAEGVKVHSHEIPLRDFLEDLRLNYSIPVGKELSLVWNYSPDLPAINTDTEKLKHILHNLINNAIKFTERGTVTISARYLNGALDGTERGSVRKAEGGPQEEAAPAPDRVAPCGDDRHGLVRFTVADTGVGIADEHFSMIFERFRQVDSSETRKYGGVGIGLYIVKKFTELLGGKVEVESEPGKGSVFTVTVPQELPDVPVH